MDKKLLEVVNIAQKAMSIYRSQWDYNAGFNWREFREFVYQNLNPKILAEGCIISFGDMIIKWDMENIFIQVQAPRYSRKLRSNSKAYKILSNLFYRLWIGW